MTRFPKIFPGWWIVLGGSIVSLWGMGYYYTGGSALFKPISTELGFSRAATSVAASIGRFEGGFESPLTGWITDKYGPRSIMVVGVTIIGLGLILMNFIHSLWGYYLVWGIITGTGVNIALSLPLEKAITNWFVRKRGLALGIRWTCSGLALVLVLPLIAWLVSTQGWRITCVIGGLVMWAVGIPLTWFSVRQQRPEYYGLLPDGATVEEKTKDTSQMIENGVKYAAEVEEVEFTLRQAMRTPAYWLLILANAAHGMPVQVVMIHCIPFLTDMGVEPVKAAVMIAATSAVSIPARLVGGLLADRLEKRYLRFLVGGAYLLQALGFGIFLLNQTINMAYVFFALYYFGNGLAMPLNAIIRGRYFGRKAFGSIHGSSQIFTTPVGVIAPIYAGWVYDTTGSYIAAFILLTRLLALSVVLMWLTFPPKAPARVTDIRKFL